MLYAFDWQLAIQPGEMLIEAIIDGRAGQAAGGHWGNLRLCVENGCALPTS